MQCTTCNKEFNRKDNYERHLKSPMHLRKVQDDGTFSCVCGKRYLQSQGLSRHKRTCRVITDEANKMESLEKHNEELIKEREEMRQQIEELFDKFAQIQPNQLPQTNQPPPPSVQNANNTTTNSHSFNTNNINSQTNNNLHVHINSFGNENLDYITNDFIHGCVNRIYESVPTILQKMHFDPEHPENHNFKIPNKKLPHASVMSEDQKWKLMDRQEAINNMIDKGYNIIDSQFREDPSKFSESKRRHYRRFQENYDTEDKDTMKRIRSDVELVVLNGTREIHNKPAALKGST